MLEWIRFGIKVLILVAMLTLCSALFFIGGSNTASNSSKVEAVITSELQSVHSRVGEYIMGDEVRYLIKEYGGSCVFQLQTKESSGLEESNKTVTCLEDINSVKNEWFVSPSSQFLVSAVYSDTSNAKLIGLLFIEKGV